MNLLSAFLVLALFCITSVSNAATSNFGKDSSHKYICVFEKHSKWYLEIDFSSGSFYSYELYRDRQALEYQTYSRLEDDLVYEFKSVDFSEGNRDAYLAYFNVQKLKVTIIRVNNKPGEEIRSYQFNCSEDRRHLLLIQ